MAKHKHEPGERRLLWTPRRIAKWLTRFFGWSLFAIAATLLLTLIVSTAIYFNRVRIVNNVLATFVKPFAISVDEIDFYPLGKVEIDHLTLTPLALKGEATTLVIPKLRLTYDFDELQATRRLTSAIIDRPTLTITEETFEALSATETPSPEPRPAPDLAIFNRFTDSLTINAGTIRLKLDNTPGVESQFAVRSGPITFDNTGMLSSPLMLSLRDLSFGREGRSGSISSIETGLRVKQDLSLIALGTVAISGIDVDITPDWFADRTTDEDSPTPSQPDSTGLSPGPNPIKSPTWTIDKLRLGDSSFRLSDFDGSDGGFAIPDIQFDTAISIADLEFRDGRWHQQSDFSLELREVSFSSDEEILASIGRLVIEPDSLGSMIHDREFGTVTLSQVDVALTDQTLARCRHERTPPTDADTENATPDSADPPAVWDIGKLVIEDGNFLMQGLTLGDSTAPRLESKVNATLEDLRFGGEEGFASKGQLAVTLNQVRFSPPGVSIDTPPFLQVEAAQISGRWNEFNFNNSIEALTLTRPQIQFTDDSLGDWLLPDKSPKKTGPVNRPVYRIRDLRVDEGTLVADSSFAEKRVPKIYSDFSIETHQSEDADTYRYQLALTDLKLRNHPVYAETTGAPNPEDFDENGKPSGFFQPIAEENVLTIRKITVDTTAEELQRTRRISEVKVAGAALSVGNGLRSLVTQSTDEKTPEAESSENETGTPADSLPAWLLERVTIDDSQVVFEQLIPQVEGLEFGVTTVLTDLPLSPSGLVSQDSLQKIELDGLEIKDPYDSFITVAELPTIFVEFSLAGLARQEVEKIDLISPSLHVGQGLFWWIDYQRNFREQNEGASVGIEGSDATSDPPDWQIKTINASAGNIIIAPTGVPIGMVPFPFDATTSMADGKIELQLNIPGEDFTYSFPRYEVDLHGLTGDILFNVPVKQVDNNVVQTFSLKRAVWKDFEAENLYLTVTFDAEGIYGQLGGDAYDGYAEGQFNYYLNDPGKWDAWIAGTGVDSGPVTEAIVPDNFLMEGKLNLKVISEGRNRDLGVTTGEIQSAESGWFDITKLDAILENLPEEWNSLQTSLTELGLYALKRFDYDQGAGSLSLEGRSGNMELRFTGPYGVRDLNLHLHDNRNTTAGVTTGTSD